MLEHLFGSVSRIQILQHFFLHPEEIFFVRELSRVLKLHLNSVRRELMNLEELGILLSQSKAPKKMEGKQNLEKTSGEKKADSIKKYYLLNPKSILAPELQSLFLKSQLLIGREVVEAITAMGNIRYLVLTGKFTSVEDKVPTDILVVGSLSREKFIKLIQALEKRLGREINYTILSSSEFKYRHNIADRFLYSILDHPNMVLVDNLEV